MKKAVAIVAAVCVASALVACGHVSSSSVPTSKPATSDGSASSEQKIEVEEEVFDVKVTLPADMVGETTQEQLDSENAGKVHSVTLNNDGSVTFVMSKSQHKEMMAEMAASLDESLSEMVGTEDYPNVQKIEHNDDYTSFTITTTSTELSLQESMSAMVYYVSGGMYNTFAGNPSANIHVDFVNADSGEIIASSDSSEMAE
ncbi:MAG TPA: flagellar hook-length control protein FliK [Candidatus Anaerofilum faecale]|nr:flagellar hook-length control protein FliK [Candidatus Anaerofilum faecale]